MKKRKLEETCDNCALCFCKDYMNGKPCPGFAPTKRAKLSSPYRDVKVNPNYYHVKKGKEPKLELPNNKDIQRNRNEKNFKKYYKI